MRILGGNRLNMSVENMSRYFNEENEKKIIKITLRIPVKLNQEVDDIIKEINTMRFDKDEKTISKNALFCAFIKGAVDIWYIANDL